MTYEEYMCNLIDETGARNFPEACMIKSIREHWQMRHKWTVTTSGTRAKFSRYWLKRYISELRDYRKWLDWCEATDREIPKTRETINQPIQMEMF